ncbi:MAG: DUF6488 family protein [Proteobacteria bacterium]|nr:DUF6488 family protein [Pseudomonadota bacterium]
MKTIYTLILTYLLLTSIDTMAHEDHENKFQNTNISMEEATLIANNHIKDQIKKQQISNSWSSAIASVAVMKRVNGRQLWSVSFTLSNENNPAPKILEINISKTGDLIQ